jgi:hypothetical protein
MQEDQEDEAIASCLRTKRAKRSTLAEQDNDNDDLLNDVTSPD